MIGRELAPGWVPVPMDAVATVLRGVSYPGSEATDRPVDGFVPILRATNIAQALNFDGLVYVPARRVGLLRHLVALPTAPRTR